MRWVAEPCKADRPEGEVVDQIASLIGKLITPDVARIGIGVPSVVDAARGIVYNVVGIPSWREVYLKDLLEKRFGVPVYVNNDCNCFALGVSRFGEASAYSDVVCVALGTGVGAGIVIGSIAHAFGFFREAMYEQLKQFPYAKTVERLHICCSSVEHVGLLGASACE